MEEARGLGELLKQGWKPKRTIIYCAWDGEEQGLLGSTEWAEAHAAELQQHAVVYINSDGNGRGYLMLIGLAHAGEVHQRRGARHQRPGERTFRCGSALQLLRIRRATERREPTQRRSGRPRSSDQSVEELRSKGVLHLDALGSGSDYTVFLDHLGVASLNIGYGGEDGGGIYHSIYDDFYWYTHFSDTDFVYGRALAQTGGTAVMRLADAELLPFDFANFADTDQAATSTNCRS